MSDDKQVQQKTEEQAEACCQPAAESTTQTKEEPPAAESKPANVQAKAAPAAQSEPTGPKPASAGPPQKNKPSVPPPPIAIVPPLEPVDPDLDIPRQSRLRIFVRALVILAIATGLALSGEWFIRTVFLDTQQAGVKPANPTAKN